MNYREIYQEVGLTSEVLGASPWRLIQILLEHLNEKINLALEALEANNIPLKCESISKANNIILYLSDCLNSEGDKDLCQRLQGIYSHLEELLFLANAKNDASQLIEAKKITENLSSWWEKVNA